MSPPATSTDATPSMVRSCGRSRFSTQSRSEIRSRVGEENATSKTGCCCGSNLKIVGGSASSGSRPRARSRFLAASWSAKSMSVPYPKCRLTPTRPSWISVSMRTRSSVTASAASSGLATVSSSTCGSTPELLTPARICGYTMVGSRSSGSPDRKKPPSTSTTDVSMMVPMGRRIEKLEMLERCRPGAFWLMIRVSSSPHRAWRCSPGRPAGWSCPGLAGRPRRRAAPRRRRPRRCGSRRAR